jgi:Tol biopolymer transport system component
MTDLRDLLDELAQRGEPRGADAVIAASRAEAERRTEVSSVRATRRRGSALIALAAIVVVALVVGVLVLRDDDHRARPRVDATTGTATTAPPVTTATNTPPPSTTFPPPTIDFAAGDFDHVAWVDGTGLVTASSADPQPKVLADGPVAHPSFSADGRWIAFGSVHVMRSEGGGDMDLPATGRSFEWSPTSDRLAWVSDQLHLTDPESGATTLIDGTGNIFDFAWSPDGNSIAISRAGPGLTTTGFEIVDVATSSVHQVAFEPSSGTGTYDPQGHNPLLFASWQPNGSAVLVWVDELGSGSIMQDGLDLWLVPIDGSEPHLLGKTLVKREWVRWNPDGSRVAIVRGSGRMVIDGPRTVTVCTTAGDCTAVSGEDNSTLDPEWSPDGQWLAFVSRPSRQQPEMHGNVPDWPGLYAARRLWVANADGSDAHQVDSAGEGVASPRFTSDGTRILYVRDDALWAIDLSSEVATRVLGPIAPVPTYQNGYQGNVAPPNAAYEPAAGNGLPTWDSLIDWISTR